MKLTVNGDSLEVQAGITVRGLIEVLKLTDGPVAVERNRDIVPRSEHERVILTDGDSVEIVHFVGGG